MAKYSVALILVKEGTTEGEIASDEFLDDILMYHGEDEDKAYKVFEDIKNGSYSD